MAENRYSQARKDAGMGREQACVKLGISIGTLSNWESGKTKPDANNLRDMSMLYGVSSDYLLGIS